MPSVLGERIGHTLQTQSTMNPMREESQFALAMKNAVGKRRACQ
jgi:hypothetical protein